MPHWEGKLSVDGVLVGLFAFVLRLLRSYKKSVVTAAELCFEVSPCAKDGAAGSAALFYIVNAFLMKHGFKVAAKLGAR